MMRKAMITEAEKPLKIVEMDVGVTPPQGARIKVTYSGVCHSDLHLVEDAVDLGDGEYWRLSQAVGLAEYVGIVPGHEIAGEVEEIGDQVESGRLQVGDRVVLFPWVGCTKCPLCKAGYSNMCEDRKHGCADYGSSNKIGGGYQSHLVVPNPEWLVKIPDNIASDIACMFPCGASTAYNAIAQSQRHIDLALSSRGHCDILVIGAGGVALWMARLIPRLYNQKQVTLTFVDISEEKLQLAQAEGAQTVFWRKNLSQDEAAKTCTQNGEILYDVAYDFVGNSFTSQVAVQTLRNGGGVVLVGLHGGQFRYPVTGIIGGSFSIHGLRTAPLSVLHKVMQTFTETPLGEVPVEYYKLDDINDIFEKLKVGKIKGRAILKMI